MDGFITLIILVIVFNLFSAVMRAIKGRSAAVGRQGPGQEIAPVRQLARFLSSFEPSDLDEPEYGEYDTVNEDGAVDERTGSLYATEVETEVTEEQEKVRVVLPEPAGKRNKIPDQVKRPAPMLGIKKVLTEKDSFLAAFVLHEILDVPPALRRRGRT